MNRINDDETFSEFDINHILYNILDYSRKNKLSQFKMGIVGAGEPLLSFDMIRQIIEYTEREDTNRILLFYTITNGTLVNKEILDFFYKNKQRITLNFSLDGYEELHNYGKDEFRKTLEGINLYENIFCEKPILNCTVTRLTLTNREAVITYFSEHGFKKVNFSQLIDIKDDNLVITYQEFSDFLRFVLDIETIIFRQGRKEKRYDCRTYGQLCGVGRTNIFITSQGIYPCCRFYKNDNYKLANFDASLYEVEASMRIKVQPVKDGECYFDKHILGRI
jgi:uncharacterized protein